MTKDKWLNLTDTVEAKFGINKEYKEDLGDDGLGEKQIIEFNGPLGRMKLEWTEKAKLQEVKTLYSNRVGSDVKVNKVYDEQEKVSYLEAFKWDGLNERWERMDENALMG